MVEASQNSAWLGRLAGSRKPRLITYRGDEKAWPKRWYTFGLWRLQNRWYIIKVTCESPYRVYFNDGAVKMGYRKLTTTPYIGVRVGQEDVTFYAVSTATGYRCVMEDMGHFGTDNQRFSSTDDRIYREISLRGWRRHITWV